MTFTAVCARLIGLVRNARSVSTINVPLALVSLGLSTALWVGVTNAENPVSQRALGAPINIDAVNLPSAMIVTGYQPANVHVTLQGPRNMLDKVSAEDLAARVDLAGLTNNPSAPEAPLDYTAGVQVSVRQRGVRAQADPSTVQVILEPVVRRVVPVEVRSADTLPAGFALSEQLTAQPTTATISGSKENIEAVDAVVANVRLGGLTVSLTQTVPLLPNDSAGHDIGGVVTNPSTASVSIKLHQLVFTRQLLVDPRVRGRPSPGYSIANTGVDPQTVTVQGSIDAINQATTLPTQDVDVGGATSNVVKTVGLQLPSGVTLADSANTLVVTVTIQPQRGPGSVAVAPRIIGLGSGLTAVADSVTVVVNLTGPVPALLQLSPADITATLDLSGLGPGGYRLVPKISVPSNVQMDGAVPDHVGVIITASGPAR